MKKLILYLNIINITTIFACFVIANLNNIATHIVSAEQINTTVLGMISLIASIAIYMKCQEMCGQRWVRITKKIIEVGVTLFTLTVAIKYILILFSCENVIADIAIAVSNALNIAFFSYTLFTSKWVKIIADKNM